MFYYFDLNNIIWQAHQSYADSDPGLLLRPQKAGYYYYNWKSFLVTDANFERKKFLF